MPNKTSVSFASFIAHTKAVRYGEFLLKSGETSNIFFDFGQIVDGNVLIKLGEFFADFIVQKSLQTVDVLFGPAYKGINIALATSIALHQKYNISIPFSYNRKVQKDHAEGGKFIGHDLSLAKTILVLDDVITDGGTKREAIEMLLPFQDLKIKAIIVGVDREELDSIGRSWRTRFMEETGVEVLSLTTKNEVLRFLE